MKKRFFYFLRGLFLPYYSENSLFLMCFTFIVLYIFDGTLRSVINVIIYDIIFFEKNVIGLFYLLLIGGLFVYGFLLSMYHAFSSRPKSHSEKKNMLLFAGYVNGIAGITSGIYLQEHSTGGLALFPVLNIINGLLHINHAVIADKGEIRDVEDRDAELPEIISGVFVTFILILVCRYIFEIYWAFTFSICVVYATNFNMLVHKVVCDIKRGVREKKGSCK